MDQNSRQSNNRLQKLMPLLLILVPLLVLGVFLVLDEKEHAANLINHVSEEIEEIHESNTERDINESIRNYVYQRWGDKQFIDLIESVNIFHSGLLATMSDFKNSQEPIYYAYNLQHLQHAADSSVESTININLSLETAWNQHLTEIFGKWLEVEGASYYIQAIDGNRSLHIHLSDFNQNDIIIRIRDAQPIILRYMEPLEVDIKPQHSSQPWFILDGVTDQLSNSIFLSPMVTFIDVSFNAQMIKDDQIGNMHDRIPGQWLSKETYRFEVNPTSTSYLPIGSFYSLEGNQVKRSYQYIELLWQDEDSVWLNTAKNLQQGHARSIYDAVLYAPNGRDYVGVVYQSGYHGIGGHYTFFYERDGEQPQIIRQRFYTAIQLDHLLVPIEWLDNEQLLVYTNEGIEIVTISGSTQVDQINIYSTTVGRIVTAAAGRNPNERFIYLIEENEPNILGYTEKEMKLYTLNVETGKLTEEYQVQQQLLSLNRWDAHQNYYTLKLINHPTGLFIPYYSNLLEKKTLWVRDNQGSVELEGHPLFSTSEGVWIRDNWHDEHGFSNQINWWIDNQGKKHELTIPIYSLFAKVGQKIIRTYPIDETYSLYQADLFNPKTLGWERLESYTNDGHFVYKHYNLIIIPPFIKDKNLTPYLREILAK